MNDEHYLNKIKELETVFSPSAPIKSRELFSGRIMQIKKLYETILQKGEHAVLYGERGVGKTSLANIIPYLFNDENIKVIKITCSKSDNFNTIWKMTLQKLKLQIDKPAIGFGAISGKIDVFLNEMLNDEKKIMTGTIMSLLSLLGCKIVFIFDEYDRIVNQKVKEQFADLIKDMSDNNDNLTIVIVGIGSSVNELIGNHPSIERCLKQVLMPKMSDEELKEIIVNAINKLKMLISEEVIQLIISYSTGFPHYTHLLTKYSAKKALQSKNLTINQNHYFHALEEILENINESVRDAYQKAIITSKKTSKFENIVAACALCETDEQNIFKTRDIVESYYKLTSIITKRQGIIYNLGKLCQKERGFLLEKVGKGNFRFKNPLIKAYIRLRLYKDGKI